MNWLLFLLLLHYSLCSYSLSSIKYTDSDTTLNVFLQGDALIGLFNTENIYGNGSGSGGYRTSDLQFYGKKHYAADSEASVFDGIDPGR